MFVTLIYVALHIDLNLYLAVFIHTLLHCVINPQIFGGKLEKWCGTRRTCHIGCAAPITAQRVRSITMDMLFNLFYNIQKWI